MGNQFDWGLVVQLYLATEKLAHAEAQRVPGGVMSLNEISGAIIETAVEIHRRLGPGLLETVYRKILAHELRKKGFEIQEECPIPVVWDDIQMELGFRTDLLVNSVVLIELKSIEKIAAVHKRVLLTHLRLADRRLGLLINFGEELLKNGIHRVVNNLEEEGSRRGARNAEIANA